MLLNPIALHIPKRAIEAAQLLKDLPDVRILAGGTFVLNNLKSLKHKGLKTPHHIVSLKKANDLKGISADPQKMTIGSMTTISELFESPLLTDNFSVLKSVCRNISTMPIRNMATIGGNLTCRYTWTEMGSVLIALGADLHFIDSDGKEEVISAENFFEGSAKTTKILRCVTIKRDKDASLSYQRVKKLSDVDIPMLAVCVKTNFKGKKFTQTRVTVNSWTTFAKRDLSLERFLDQSDAVDGVPTESLNHLDTTIYDTRSDDYKRAMFRVSLKNAISDLIKGERK